MPETVIVQEVVLSMIKNANSNEEVVEKSFQYFDALYSQVTAGWELP
jgi:hypothetical protein